MHPYILATFNWNTPKSFVWIIFPMKNSQVPISNLFPFFREDFITQSEPLVWDIIWQSQCDAVTRQNNKTRFCNSMMTNTLLRSLMRHQFGDKTKSKFASLAFSTSCEIFLHCGRLLKVINIVIFFVFCFGKNTYLKWKCEMKKKYKKIIHLPTVYKVTSENIKPPPCLKRIELSYWNYVNVSTT